MPDRSPRHILENWRELERLQLQAEPDGADYVWLELEIARLRSEYHRLTALHVATADQLRAASRESLRRVDVSAEIIEETRSALRYSRRRRSSARDSD